MARRRIDSFHCMCAAADPESYVSYEWAEWDVSAQLEVPDQFVLLAKREQMSLLSREAREVISLVVNVPVETLEAVFGGEQNQHNLRRELKKNGWKYPTISRTFNEIKIFLKNF